MRHTSVACPIEIHCVLPPCCVETNKKKEVPNGSSFLCRCVMYSWRRKTSLQMTSMPSPWRRETSWRFFIQGLSQSSESPPSKKVSLCGISLNFLCKKCVEEIRNGGMVCLVVCQSTHVSRLCLPSAFRCYLVIASQNISSFIVIFYMRFVKFLDTFATLRKVNIRFVMSVLTSRTTRLSMDGFSWNLIFEDCLRICRENSGFLKIGQH